MALAAVSARSSGTPAMSTRAPPALLNPRPVNPLSWMMLIVGTQGHRLRSTLYRGDDAHVRATPAEVRRGRSVGEGGPDLGFARVGRPGEQVDRHDDHPVLAVAALWYLLVDPGLLD